MIPAFVWEYKLILRFIIRVSSHLKEALCVFGGSTIQEFTVIRLILNYLTDVNELEQCF
jgi:hypothetical protein